MRLGVHRRKEKNMKRKILLVLAIMSLLTCIFAITAFADGIVANTITSETYGTVYQLSADPGLDGADAYVSTLNTIDDQGTDKTSLSILYDGTYYYVFPSSYLVDELSNGKFSFTLTMGAGNNFSSKQKGINNVFAEWNEAEGTSLPTFEVSGTWGSTKVNSLIRFEVPTDIKYFDGAHCLIKGDALIEVVFTHSPSCGSSLFNGNASMTTVKGFEKLTGVSKTTHVFRNCSSLKSVRLPSDVTSIGTEMFYACTQFTGVENWDEIKDNVTSIGNYAFYNCDSLVSIHLPSVTSLGTQSFAYSDNLEYVGGLAGTTLKDIGSSFRNCPKLDNIELPETLTSIGRDAFHGCSSLTSIKVPRDCTTLGPYAFNGCSKLELIDMSGAVNLKSTDQNTFSGTIVHELIFPEGFESFGGIGSNSNLKKIEFPNSTTTLKGMAWLSITEFTVPLGVTSLGTKQFDYCQSLNTVIIHGGVTSIVVSGNGSFFGTSPKNIIYTGNENDPVVEQIRTALPKATITFANQCITYYGEHAEGEVLNSCQFGCGRNCGMVELLENPQHNLNMVVTYAENGYFGTTCAVETCSVCKTVTVDEAIGAMFVDYGYSATEAPINGAYSMSQFYGINRGAIELYKTITGVEIEYGFVVAANADPFGAVANGELASDKIFVAEQRFFAYDYVSVKVSGITDATADKAIAFCMFVRDGENVYYLDGGKTSSTIEMKSFNDLA